MEPRPSRQAKDYVFVDMFNQPIYEQVSPREGRVD